MRGWITARLISCIVSLATMSGSPAYSQNEGQEQHDCFDALVTARVVEQTPSVMRECGDDCIIMRWPWFLAIDIRQVLTGKAPNGRLTVLSLQHTDIRKDFGVRRWWLRRNSVGGFNLLGEASGSKLMRCPSNSPPAVAFITPRAGETPEGLRRQGAKRYGRER
jgi:hypothetical protein